MFSLPLRERRAAYGTQLRFSNLKQSIFAANLHREVELVIPVLSTRKADPITRLQGKIVDMMLGHEHIGSAGKVDGLEAHPDFIPHAVMLGDGDAVVKRLLCRLISEFTTRRVSGWVGWGWPNREEGMVLVQATY